MLHRPNQPTNPTPILNLNMILNLLEIFLGLCFLCLFSRAVFEVVQGILFFLTGTVLLALGHSLKFFVATPAKRRVTGRKGSR